MALLKVTRHMKRTFSQNNKVDTSSIKLHIHKFIINRQDKYCISDKINTCILCPLQAAVAV